MLCDEIFNFLECPDSKKKNCPHFQSITSR